MNNRYTKSNKKIIAIISLICGIISVIPVMTIYLNFWLFLVSFPAALLGLICGKMGLKSTKRGLAIGGIALSIIGLGIFIFLMVIALWYQSIIYPAPGIFR
ncbi:hypothetical protein J7J12_01805 [bacterium]|nr:hypothetical protein [bacterium]